MGFLTFVAYTVVAYIRNNFIKIFSWNREKELDHVPLQLEHVTANRSHNHHSNNQGLKTVYIYNELRFRDVTLIWRSKLYHYAPYGVQLSHCVTIFCFVLFSF